MLCFSVEAIGLLLVGFADTPMMAKIGTFLPGLAFRWSSGAGVVAVKAVPQHNQGRRWRPYRVYGFVVGRQRAAGRIADGLDRISMIYLAAAGW